MKRSTSKPIESKSTKSCLNCSAEFSKPRACSRRYWEERKFCTKNCAIQFRQQKAKPFEPPQV